jgi:UDP-N-acetylmuramate: L-alanyl-gamma-D-glutamyl-meso-diaminopimelate ligase
MSGSQAKIVSYGFDTEADFNITNVRHQAEKTLFNIAHQGKVLGTFETQLLGGHNVQNICGVVAFMVTHRLCETQDLYDPIASFRGITRRLDRKSEKTSIHIYEGFGSSYTKARTAITALQEHFADKKLFVLFEPHTFSWRNRQSLDWYHTVFEGVDTVGIYPPPGHGSSSHDQLSYQEIIDEVRGHFDGEALKVSDLDSIKTTLRENVKSGDVLLILTSGSFDGNIKNIVDWCESEY